LPGCVALNKGYNKYAVQTKLGRPVPEIPIGSEFMNRMDEVLNRLRTFKPRLQVEFKVREIEMFGSLARGTAGKDSDVDLLVEFEEGADLFDQMALAEFLEGELGRKVDVVSKGALRKEFRDAVLAEAVPV
jgi:predicted nucleotidyltransferase